MSGLAILGGSPSRDTKINPWPKWPVWDEKEEKALLEVLNSGDSGILMISWDNGTESIIESGWWQPHMDGTETATGLYGTKGYANVFPTYLKYKVGGVPGKFDVTLPVRTEHCEQGMYNRQMEHYVDCIRSRKQPVSGLTEGQIILDIVDATYLSSKTGEVVNL